jgi:CrcB protein
MSPLSAWAIAAVAAGGAAGSVARYLVSVGAVSMGLAPAWGTLAVNVMGGFAIGAVAELFVRGTISAELRLLLVSGFLGGFTTFSAFSLDVITLWRGGAAHAGLYAAASVALSVKACLAGMLFVRSLL